MPETAFACQAEVEVQSHQGTSAWIAAAVLGAAAVGVTLITSIGPGKPAESPPDAEKSASGGATERRRTLAEARAVIGAGEVVLHAQSQPAQPLPNDGLVHEVHVNQFAANDPIEDTFAIAYRSGAFFLPSACSMYAQNVVCMVVLLYNSV